MILLKVGFCSDSYALKRSFTGARIDRGDLTLEQKEVDTFCRSNRISGGYVGTSARTAVGLGELIERLKGEIPWDQISTTVTTETFKKIKEYVLSLKERENDAGILVDPAELSRLLSLLYPEWQFSDADIHTAIGHLAKHGYITILHMPSGKDLVLLAPHVLNNLAASFILEARRNQKGLGSLEENQILNGAYNFPETSRLNDWEREVLLDAAIVLFLKHTICFREILGTETFLIFPSLINLKKPVIDEMEIVDDISYTVIGAVENVYAALVVLLGYTNTFTRTNQWQNQAQYEMGSGEVCGFRQIAEKEGLIDLVLYYSMNTSQTTRTLFQALFERFLAGRKVKVERYQPIVCPSCRYSQERQEVVKRIRQRRKTIFCGDCGNRIELPKQADEVVLVRDDLERVDEQERTAKLRTAFETALSLVKRFIRDNSSVISPSCFLSYAWGDPRHERWVSRLAKDLISVDVQVLLDQFDGTIPGTNIARFISRITESKFIVAIGTPLYRHKYENKVSEMGSIVAAEVDLINVRLTATEQEKDSILPVLFEGDAKEALPPLMRGRVHIDFREEEYYFNKLLDLILTIYGISLRIEAVNELRASIGISSMNYV